MLGGKTEMTDADDDLQMFAMSFCLSVCLSVCLSIEPCYLQRGLEAASVQIWFSLNELDQSQPPPPPSLGAAETTKSHVLLLE
jgi:hypothetical protein